MFVNLGEQAMDYGSLYKPTGEQDMIREFAFGLANRHHFMDSTDISKWTNIARDTFHSLWEYDEEVKNYVKKKKSTTTNGTVML